MNKYMMLGAGWALFIQCLIVMAFVQVSKLFGYYTFQELICQ